MMLCQTKELSAETTDNELSTQRLKKNKMTLFYG